ncbi:MAG: hypothetical protein ABIJ39_10830 [Chloroflexota bacterium]
MDTYNKLERLTRKRVFYLLLILIPASLPPIAVTGFGYLAELPEFSLYLSAVLFELKAVYAPYMPVLHLVVVFLLLALFIFRRRFGRVFALLVGLNLVLTAVIQATAVTERYGLVILTQVFLWYAIVFSLWFWEAWIGKTDFSFKGSLRPWWLIPLAIYAFWDPDQAWNFDLSFFVYGFAPTAFCMMNPIYLTVLLFNYPNVNLPLVRVHSFIGLVVGVISLAISFIQEPSAGIYWAILHSPLIITALYGFRLGLKATPETGARPVPVAVEIA